MSEDKSFDLEKMRSVGYLSGGRTRDQVREGRREDGVRTKAVTDQLGNTTTEHAKGDRVDVNIKAPQVAAAMTVREERD